MLDRDTALYCATADNETDGDYPYHYWDGGLTPDYWRCKYCGMAYSEYTAQLKSNYDDYVSTLDSTKFGSNYVSYNGIELAKNKFTDDASYPYAMIYHLVNSSGSNSSYYCVASNSYFYLKNSYTIRSTSSTKRHLSYYGPSGWSNQSTETVSGFSTVYGSSSARPTIVVDWANFSIGGISATEISEPDNASTRFSSTAQALADYNYANSFQDSNSVNYYMGTTDDSGSVTNFYDINVYNEETLVFTEPVTGAQYQSTGWVYDYTTRSYDIELESGTFYIDDTEITEIVLVYGDDAVTIAYADSSSNVVQMDTYSYVMVASSECNLYGHSYSAETTKDSTCTSVGERTYTCSVCGDQYVEEITMLAHAYTAAVTKEPTCTSTGTRMYTCSGCGGQYTEEIPMSEHSYVWSVLKEPTCTDSGLYIYTCSGCGGQHTESVEALGHDWISTDSADDTYMLPEGTSCPDCSGTDFAAELDEINGVYSCTCNSCGSSWTTGAEITSGYTLYTCSRCGAMKTVADSDGDGLFASIGNFFADGINWCTEKLSQLADNLTSMVDSFNDYMDSLSEGGEFPGFISAVIGLLPDDLTNVIWFGIVAAVIVFVLCKWFK